LDLEAEQRRVNQGRTPPLTLVVASYRIIESDLNGPVVAWTLSTKIAVRRLFYPENA
jgi:hypothetical protein